MMSVSTNMVLNVVHHEDFGRIKDGLIKLILIFGFNGILDIIWVEEVKMIKDKLKDGKGL